MTPGGSTAGPKVVELQYVSRAPVRQMTASPSAIRILGSGSGGSAGNQAEFESIRLAQRTPVRVKLGKLRAGVELRVGMTGTVIVLNGKS